MFKSHQSRMVRSLYHLRAESKRTFSHFYPSRNPLTTLNPPSEDEIYHYKSPSPYYYSKKGELDGKSPFNSSMQRWEDSIAVDRDCNEVRRLINRLIDSREMTALEFCETIGVSTNSCRHFMCKHGTWKGSKSDAFSLSLRYFQDRERNGVAMPRKFPAKMPSKLQIAAAKVTLDGEQEDKVPVYDTCDEVRRKVNAYMKQEGVTQKSFLKELEAQYHAHPTKIKISDLEKFRGAAGPNVPNANPVFYAAYVFFEKIRVGTKKEKSKLRAEMEEIYKDSGGVNVKVSSGQYGIWLDKLPRGSLLSFEKTGLASMYNFLSSGSQSRTTKYGPPGHYLAKQPVSWYSCKAFVYE